MGGIMKKVKDKLNELEISNSKMKFKWVGALKKLKFISSQIYKFS